MQIMHICVVLKKHIFAITSDSGKVVFAEYYPELHRFAKLLERKFGPPGCLRKVPGQYLRMNEQQTFLVVGESPYPRHHRPSNGP